MRLIFGVLLLSLVSTSCIKQKTQARVFIPPAARVKPPLPEGPVTLSDPPQISAELATPPSLPEFTVEVPEAPKRIVRRPAPRVDPPKPPVVTPDPTPPPRLAQMLTAEERRANTKALEESLDSANRILAIVEGRNLTAEQKEIAERIRTFRKQAEQAREEDLLTAVSLARRADLLAKDLLGRLP